MEWSAHWTERTVGRLAAGPEARGRRRATPGEISRGDSLTFTHDTTKGVCGGKIICLLGEKLARAVREFWRWTLLK